MNLILPPDSPLLARPSESPPQEQQAPVHLLIAQYVGQSIAAKVAAEIKGYIERNRIPAGEVHANLTADKKRDALYVELSHQQNDIRIIGTAVRKFKIEWRVK